jgi:hypothetical protein
MDTPSGMTAARIFGDIRGFNNCSRRMSASPARAAAKYDGLPQRYKPHEPPTTEPPKPLEFLTEKEPSLLGTVDRQPT